MIAIAINHSSQHFHPAPLPLDHPTVIKMQSFQHLCPGWHYGEGVSCTPDALQQAMHLHASVTRLGFSETDAFPGIDGGILLTIYDGVEYLAFRLEIDGTITYCRETQDVEVEERDNLTLAQANDILRAYRQETWTRSDYYTSATMIATKAGSLRRLLHPIVAGYLLWTPFAFSS